MKNLPIILGVALICLNSGAAHAEEAVVESNQATDVSTTNIAPGAVIIEGDRLQVHLNREYKSIGNAVLHRHGQDVYGDSIEYDAQNEELHVVGHTRIETDDISLWGEELHLNLGEDTGEMKGASFRTKESALKSSPTTVTKTTDSSNEDDSDIMASSSIVESEPLSKQNIEDGGSSYAPELKKRPSASRGDAKTILFEGQDRKRLKDARYTTCEADSDDWYIKAKEMELNDYTKSGTATNAWVEFKGVPLLYTPWIGFSFLNQRKSGFLAPTVGTTSLSGFETLVPYYWNISPNLDATTAARYLSKRGTQMQGELRYLGENYSGIDNIEYLPDDDLTGDNRYYANLEHQQSFGNGWSAGYHLEKVSDDEYFSDLSTRITTTSRVNLAQQANVNYVGDVWRFNGLVQKYQTLDDESFPYERLPQLTLSADKDWSVVNTKLYSQWVSFDRNSDAPRTLDTVSGGILTTSVTGDRLTVYPSIEVPFARPYGYITPKFGVHYTDYHLDNEAFNLNGVAGNYESDNRTLPIFSLDSGLYFDRDMRVVKNHYTQTLEPRLYYVYIPNKNQDDLPVFDSAESDLNLGTLFLENQFTGNDRVNNANQLSLALTTRLIDSDTGIQRLAATLGQRFYFTDQKVSLPGAELRTGDTSDIVTAVTARLTNHWNVDTAWQYNTDRSTTVKSNLGARFNPEPGKVLNLSYRYTEDNLEQINISGQWPFSKGWYAMGRWNYSMREHDQIEGLAGIEYDAGCWQARSVIQQISTATADSNYAFFFQLELGGLASIGSNPMTLLKRSIPGYTDSGFVPNSYQQQSYE